MNGAVDECMPDTWGDGLTKLVQFVYELTPIPDAVGCLGGSAEACAWLAASAIPGARLLRGVEKTVDAARAGGRACKVNSFVPGTEVLMADGSTKPIEDVEIGDQVLATDPVTGETGPREVVATIVGQGRKDLVELTVDTDGPAGDQTGTVVATANHPFWIDNHGRWIHAEDLRTGDDLRVAGTSQGEVLAVRSQIRYQRVHNLTINDIQTYHVLAGAAPTLVHNCPEGPRNGHLAGDKHPATGVPFDVDGYPDFSAWRHPDVPDVRIELTGSRGRDRKLANEAAGLKKEPPGYTWHHHQDAGLMQLVRTDVHRATGHTGGFSRRGSGS